MQVFIRRLTVEDATALSKISAQTFFETFAHTCTKADMEGFLTETYDVKKITNELADTSDFYFFAEVDGQPVGYLRFKQSHDNYLFVKQKKAIELIRIYVLKEYYGKGVAQQLMNIIFEYSKKENYEVIFLGVWEHNERAQKFYEKFGFRNTGYTHDFPIGSTPQTDNWFCKMV
jgi:diamine N-acetyltransferase